LSAGYWSCWFLPTNLQAQDKDYTTAMRDAGSALESLLSLLPKSESTVQESAVRMIVYIDEADTLTHDSNIYAEILSAFTDYDESETFLITLSTNSRLQSLAPSPTFAASARAQITSQLAAPFTELAAEPFAKSGSVQPGITDAEVCKLEFLAKFGRPL
jgi:hypothetical protein